MESRLTSDSISGSSRGDLFYRLHESDRRHWELGGSTM